MLKTLVITSCTGEKKFSPETKLLKSDFESSETLPVREQELSSFTMSASEMYTGMQHLRLMEGISLLREKFGRDVLDLAIVSAGYGLIEETRPIVPYEVTFNDMSSSELLQWSSFLKIKESLGQIIQKYDLVFFLLGDKYLRALQLPINADSVGKRWVFLASNTSRKLIPNDGSYSYIQIGQEDAASFGYGLVGLKGFLFKLFSQEVVREGVQILEKIYSNPNLVSDILDKYRKTPIEKKSITLFPDLERVRVKKKSHKKKEIPVVHISPEFYAKNYGKPMKYFIPEWDDRVDPYYDFITDKMVENRNPYLHDFYAHELYNTPNYDGILVSKITIESNQTKKSLIEQMGIHNFLRFSEDAPVMGDCGAFGYISEYEPPYNTEEILNYYETLGFNYGVSIDHLIVGNFAKDPGERERRYKITEKNAEDFLRKHREGKYTFTPMGVAQGWDQDSYRKSVANLIDMGYKYISLGGLARSKTTEILDVLQPIAPLIPEDLDMHLFGVSRLDAIDVFRKLGVTSFDSASYLRKAWLSSASNYISSSGQHYAAIRIPQVEGPKIKKLVDAGKGTREDFCILEKESLKALNLFDRGELGLEETLKAVLAYDEAIGNDPKKHEKQYRKVLEDQPWKMCDCKICGEVGINVIIFRGNNRNRRRGFHNTYVFYKEFQSILAKDKI